MCIICFVPEPIGCWVAEIELHKPTPQKNINYMIAVLNCAEQELSLASKCLLVLAGCSSTCGVVLTAPGKPDSPDSSYARGNACDCPAHAH